jgi:hypothetical protein
MMPPNRLFPLAPNAKWPPPVFRQATGPHAPILSFDATASAQRTLRQPSDATAEALDGIPLVLLNCTTEAPMAEWQT